jgi:pteridine reductase
VARWDLAGKVAVVTGGGTRVGAAIAHALAQAGCDVVVHYASNARGAAQVANDAARLGRRATTVQADLTDRASLARLADEATSFGGGGVDVLVNNAASFERVPPSALDAEAWDRAMALNATAPYLLTLALAPGLRARGGTMIAIACISADRPWRAYLPYSVSKAALAHLVRGLAVALAPEVRVNAVAPGTVLPPEGYDEAKRDKLAASAPLRRLGAADDVARAVVFLAENDFITGQILRVDGGRSLV